VNFALLAELPPTVRQSIVARLGRRSFKRGEVLFHEGDPGDSLHLIEKGRVAIRPSTPNGDVVTLVVLGPGACFGEQALINAHSLRTASAVAMGAVETRVLHRRDMDELRREQPSIDRFLVHALAAQVQRLSGQVLEALYVPADKRVVRRLAHLAELYDRGVTPIDIDVRQEDLATMAGTTRPTTNRVLHQLIEIGLISVHRGHIDVLDRDGLADRARR
jgi:CRP-like cAMP-binding protein